MKKQPPISIWLKRFNTLSSSYDYQVTKIANAVTVWLPAVRIGDIISEDLAKKLAGSYRVTIK